MHERIEPPSTYAWIVNAAALLMVGGLGGYLLAGPSLRTATRANEAITQAPAAAPIADEDQLRAYRDILARDPGNVQAAVNAGNLLYDARRYREAIGFYERALAADGSNINVRTDLGTALWYAGRPDDALAQYDRSLAIDPHHAQTLFNVGIVKADGKHDYAGAIGAWETLLTNNPGYSDVTRVQSLIADARRNIAAAR